MSKDLRNKLIMREIDYAKKHTLKLLEERGLDVVDIFSGEYDGVDCHMIEVIHNTIRYTFYFDVEGCSYWLMMGGIGEDACASETTNFKFHEVFLYIENTFKINL